MLITTAWMILFGLINLLMAPMPGNWWGAAIAVACFLLPFTKAGRS